jgi:hypothetical protein
MSQSKQAIVPQEYPSNPILLQQNGTSVPNHYLNMYIKKIEKEHENKMSMQN